MKTFKEYGGDTVDPHYHAYGGSLLGPSLGHIDQLQTSMQTDTTIPKNNYLGQSNLEQMKKRSPSQT